MKKYITPKIGGVFYVSAFVSLLAVASIISGQVVGRADAVTGTSKIVVSRVNSDNAYFSGTKANIDASITAANAKLANPAIFTNLTAGAHTVSVSKQQSSLTLKSVKMCTAPDTTTTCTPNISVSFTCTATECKTSNITAGARPVYVRAIYGRVY